MKGLWRLWNVRYGGVPEGFLEDRELREVFLPILRADIEVVETYEFGDRGRVGCAVMGFAGGWRTEACPTWDWRRGAR